MSPTSSEIISGLVTTTARPRVSWKPPASGLSRAVLAREHCRKLYGGIEREIADDDRLWRHETAHSQPARSRSRYGCRASSPCHAASPDLRFIPLLHECSGDGATDSGKETFGARGGGRASEADRAGQSEGQCYRDAR